MKMRTLFPIMALCLASACSTMDSGQESLVAAQAERMATCHNGADCTAKWALAKNWLLINSTFPISTETDTLIETGQPPFYSPKSGFTIAMATRGYGFSEIQFASSCGLVSIGCNPDTLALKASFVSYVMAGPAPVLPKP
jgi:hypothetical protein